MVFPPIPISYSTVLPEVSSSSSSSSGATRRPRTGRSPGAASAWYPAPFTVDGLLYPTAEHWMVAEKARLFDDDPAVEAILAATTPKAAKAQGRKV